MIKEHRMKQRKLGLRRDKDHYNGRKSDATDIGTDSLSDLEPEVEILNDNSDDMKDVDNKDNEKDEAPKKLNYKPTEINENGVEVVIFDEMIMKKGSERWNLIFNNKEGMQAIIDKGLWMVNNRPLIMQKWNLEIGMQKAEHCKLPVWVRMTDVPLEAWSTDGISALASSLGIPLIMDAITASMCHSGMGRTDFARVLIEMDANKEFKSVIEVQIKTPEEVKLEKVRRDEQMKKKSVINENRAYKRDKNFGYYHNYVRDKGKSTNEKADSIRNNRNRWTGVVNKRQEYRKKQGETSKQGKESNMENNNDGRK
ncbi:zinc knuckle CX2CX4HX4C containing protein [Tanacetum coccineum]